MALRVLQATSRAGGAVAASASRAAASAGPVRFFSDAVAEEDEAAKLAKIAAENALMEKLQQQQFADADISVMPFHAGPRAAVTVDDAPLPYPAETALVSGTDKWTGGRKVRILKPARHQMQSGTYNTKHWEIRFESARTWENPLMGWTSSKDPLAPQVYKFDTQEEAVAFAEKQGWEMEIKEPAPVGDFSGKISYSHNFLPEDVENLVKREGKKSHVHFRHPTGRRSNWVKTLKYHGNGVVAQHGGEAKN